MKSRLSVFLCVVVAIVASGCFKPVENVELPEVKPKLVVFSFISPERSEIVVQVSWSKPILNTVVTDDYPPVGDANVQISNGQQSAVIPFDPVRQEYVLAQSVFTIAGGQHYTLTVTAASGESVKAVTTVPVMANTSLDISGSQLDTIEDEFDTYLRPLLKVKWHDVQGKGNYYRVVPLFVRINLIVNDTFDLYTYGDFGTVSDEHDDGKEITRIYGRYERIHNFPGSSDDNKFLVYLYQVDEHYFHFHNTLGQVVEEESPFAQPSPYYNNVEGGIGVFGSYRVQVTEKQL